MAKGRDYTPPPATADQLAQVLRSMHFDRVIIVTPTIYDNDNSATLAALKQLGRDRARGVAAADETMPPKALDSLSEGGIVGMRVFLGGEASKEAAAVNHLQAKFELAKARGWHLEISAPPDAVANLRAQLASAPVPLLFVYFGWVKGGVDQPGFHAVLSLLKSGKAYVKLSEPYRVSKKGPDYPNLVPVVKAYLAANPDRLLWGSGWSHVDSSSVHGRKATDLAPDLPIDNAHLLDLLAAWVPDAQTRRKILVDNPARLYGF